jgi:cytoskeletal protein CcmA (bactofilin family)
MMTSLLFIVTASAWLMLPLLPALRELYKPTDDGALDVFQGNAADARDGLHGLLPEVFSTPATEWSAALNEKNAQLWDEAQLTEAAHHAYQNIVAPRSLRVSGCPAGVATIHANELLLTSTLATSARMSAARWVLLEPGVKFQVLQAPRIQTGLAPANVVEPTPLPANQGSVAGATHYAGQGWWRASGDAEVAPAVLIHGDVIAEGRLVLGKGSRIEGSLKTKGTVVLEEGSVVTGSVVANNVVAAAGVSVHGSILATTTVSLATRTVVGSPTALASVVCSDLTLQPGVIVHGGICANGHAEVTLN